MKQLGRGLQLFALLLLPFVMFMEMTGGLGRSTGVSDMVLALACGIAAFLVGRLLEGYAGT